MAPCRFLNALLLMFVGVADVIACTSAIVAPEATRSGNMLMWKHRDTSHTHNYVDTVNAPSPDSYSYLALFNAEDSLKREAWAGVNCTGFAIMNTVAGNLPENGKECIDREGFIMSDALLHCSSVADFEHLLDSLPKPLGSRANFGVIDSHGNAAYFETSDSGYVKYLMEPGGNGVMIRSNFAFSGADKGGYGYDRYNNAKKILERAAKDSSITPELFTEFISRKYYNADTDRVLSPDNTKKAQVPDKGYIPRPTSASSVVVELTPTGPVMWVMLGYPPAAETHGVTLESVRPALRRNALTDHSDECDRALKRKESMLNNGCIIVSKACEISSLYEQKSLKNYESFRSAMQQR